MDIAFYFFIATHGLQRPSEFFSLILTLCCAVLFVQRGIPAMSTYNLFLPAALLQTIVYDAILLCSFFIDFVQPWCTEHLKYRILRRICNKENILYQLYRSYCLVFVKRPYQLLHHFWRLSMYYETIKRFPHFVGKVKSLKESLHLLYSASGTRQISTSTYNNGRQTFVTTAQNHLFTFTRNRRLMLVGLRALQPPRFCRGIESR